MSSLRASVATSPRFPRSDYNLSAVAAHMRMDLPISVTALMGRLDRLPEQVEFQETIVTGAALGGEVRLTLHSDGRYNFSGTMNASGIPSFAFRVTAIVRGPNGGVLVAAQHSGEVFGTDTPGKPRRHNWDILGTDAKRMALIRETWPEISAGHLNVTHSSELSGVLGTAVDLAKDLAELLIVAETLGTGMAVCMFLTAELGEAGVEVPGLGGTVGIGVVGGALLIWGPLAVGPAILLGVAAGAIVDAMIIVRRLHDEEMDLARRVFGDTLNFEKIRLTNLLGVGGAPFTFPTFDDMILINIGEPIIQAADRGTKNGYPVPGQLLIHELTHAWQIQHATLENGFVPGWLCRGADEQIEHGKAAYNIGEPGPDWTSFGIEAQAAIVDRWYSGIAEGTNPPKMMDEDSPLFRYIEGNIRIGEAGFGNH